MDLKIECNEGKFKFRVCGILEHNGKYLILKMNQNNFYCLPGGHAELFEDTEQAVLREMREELGYDVKINSLVAINQNFFIGNDGAKMHELGFYYIVNAVNKNDINTSDYYREELDKGKIQHLNFKWASKEELKNLDFRPHFLIDCLDNKEPLLNITRD